MQSQIPSSEKAPPSKGSAIIEGGKFSLPRTRNRVIPRSKLRIWAQHGWYETRSYGPNVEIRRARYNKWQNFEMKLRYLLLRLGFDDCVEDIEDFSYTDLGPQIDACGGYNGTFFVIDCTSKQEVGQKSIAYKIEDILKKEKKVSQAIDKEYPKRYPNKTFVICTEDIEVSEKEKQEARDAGIRIIDGDQVNEWFKYYGTLGLGLKYHIAKSLSSLSSVILDNERDPFFHYPAFKLTQDSQTIYHFMADPERLLKLAYVYRLESGNPEGYQRPLIRKKILNINGFLTSSGNYFANNLVLCFDSLVNNEYWPDFEPVNGSNAPIVYGTLHIPKAYCSAEVIDGQHRLYGYLDASEDQSNRGTL